MSRFYLLLWLKWSLRLSISSTLGAILLSFLVTLFIYFKQGMQTLNDETYSALFLVFKFWFPLFWSITLLVSLFRSLKYIFNTCYNGYELTLLECHKESKSEKIELIGYGDLVKVWRRWLMLLIWLVGAQMIIALILTKLFASFDSVFEWFNIYVLYSFLLLSGYISFVLLSSRCKKVKVKKC